MSAKLNVSHEIPNPDAQRIGNRFEGFNGSVLLASLNGSDVGSVEAGNILKLVLAPAFLLTYGTDSFPHHLQYVLHYQQFGGSLLLRTPPLSRLSIGSWRRLYIRRIFVTAWTQVAEMTGLKGSEA